EAGRAAGGRDDLDVVAGLAHADGLLDTVLVHAVDDERDAVQVDAAGTGADPRFGVGDLFQDGQDLHVLLQMARSGPCERGDVRGTRAAPRGRAHPGPPPVIVGRGAR